jgi:hypothetical protein
MAGVYVSSGDGDLSSGTTYHFLPINTRKSWGLNGLTGSVRMPHSSSGQVFPSFAQRHDEGRACGAIEFETWETFLYAREGGGGGGEGVTPCAPLGWVTRSRTKKGPHGVVFSL